MEDSGTRSKGISAVRYSIKTMLLPQRGIHAMEQKLAEARAKVEDLESNKPTWVADGSVCFATVYKEQTGLSPDQWKDLVKKLVPPHHALLADFKRLQAQFQELEGKQEGNESTSREAQTEAWTKKHIHEEVCRTVEVSKQMHKEANERAATLAERYETLEIRYDMNQKVTERMLADSWQANPSKDERIRILASNLTTGELTRELDDKQSQLHEAETRLVVTQRLAEDLHNQLTDAKGKHTELEVANKDLECQPGEAKVRLDHDYQDEERRKAELGRANADVEEFMQCSNSWQHLAVSNLDDYAPEVIAQVKKNTLQTLQDKLDEATGRIGELAECNQALQIDIDDLEYELSINERRLTRDESIKVGFYERHWSTVKEIFDGKKSKDSIDQGI